MEKTLEELRKKIDEINLRILELLNLRMEIVQEIRKLKEKAGLEFYDPMREAEMLENALLNNPGPATAEAVKRIFREIFRASLREMEREHLGNYKVSPQYPSQRRVIMVRGKGETGEAKSAVAEIGGERSVIIAGPCAIESEHQFEAIAALLSSLGLKFIRGGAFKPRSSPYSFQGLREEGLRILRDIAREYGLITVSEVVDTRDVELVSEYVDIIQIGARNMFNYELLKMMGEVENPILLKRSFMASIQEYILAAEYIAIEGNENIILCERGIRTFETETRNTIDISAIPILKAQTVLPVIVDVSHGTGRKDILIPMSKAALAAGADGIMLEVHPYPEVALSDSFQQLNFDEFKDFLKGIGYGNTG